MFSVEKIRLRKNLINVYKNLKEGCKDNRARLFSLVPSNRTRDNGHKLKRRKFHRNIRKHLFAVEMTEHWQVAQRGVEVSPSLGYSEAI